MIRLLKYFKGQFLLGYTSYFAEIYFAQLSIPSINLGSVGEFEISFYAFMSCDNKDCGISGDTIKVFVYDNDISNKIIANFIIDYSNNPEFVRWKKFSFRFLSYDSNINVNIKSLLLFVLCFLLSEV